MPAGPDPPVSAPVEPRGEPAVGEPALAAALEQLAVPVFVTAAGGRVLWANGAARELLAWLGVEAVPGDGSLAHALGLEPEDAGRLAAVLEGGVPAAVGVTAPGGVALAALAGPLRRGDEVVGAGVVVVERDRLPRPRPEDAPDDPLLALGRLAAGAAHEIRNPLTAIQGFLQLLERECRSPASGRYLQIIRQEMRRIEGIAADLLLLSRPAETPAVPCALPELLQRTGELLAERAAASGVRIELEAPVSVPPVAAVPERLQQVFLNLLGNAIEAMPRGGAVRVRVSGGPPGPGDCVEVAVEDEGPGVPPDVLPRLFEPFFTTKAGGTGLGLAVSQSIVRTFGGDIAVESPPGGGAVFTVRLPAARARPGAGRFHPGRLPAG